MSLYAALPVLAAITLVLAIVVPLLRTWIMEGVFALVRPTEPLQRFVHGVFAATLLGYGVFTVALAALGADPLGVYRVSAPTKGVGLGIAGVGLLIVVLAQAQMGRSWRIGIERERTPLVTHGLFRISRNPIYLGLLVVVLGVAVVAPSGWTIVGAVLVYVQVGVQARAEEQHLIGVHGNMYVDWGRRVGRFVPLVGRLD